MAHFVIWVDVRDKNTNHTFRRNLEHIQGIDWGKALQAFDKGEAYETGDFSITKSATQPEDIQEHLKKEYQDKMEEDRRNSPFGGVKLP